MALDDFLRELDSARSEGADDGDAPHSGFEVVEVGAVGQVLIRPKAEVSSIPQACSLVAEVLPPTPEPRINIRDTFFDPLAILQERQEEEIGAESIWDSEYRGVARAFPSAPRTELELARPPIWSSDPANGAVPEFAEAPIDEDVLASGDGSSSLRRVPADKAFQLKGASQNTPFRPGGFEKKSTGANPAVAYEAARSLALLDFSKELLSTPPGFDNSTDFTKIFDAVAAGAAAGAEVEHDELAPQSDIEPEPMPEFQDADASDAASAAAEAGEAGETGLVEVIGSGVVKLDSIFADEDDDSDDAWSDEEEEGISEPSQQAVHVAPSASLEPEVESTDESDLDDLLHAVQNFSAASAAKTKESEDQQWAVEGGEDMSRFRELVPQMAIEYPFELDNFQKEAIVHLEKNENVFVAAHTSAGKTVVAEYGIAMAFQHCTKTIYTSPIKTLSNQKYREFVETFEDVGIVTGDISINPTANCVIMTTEILRSMLYKGSDLIRDVEWVIFDEVHYLNDEERGVVWEEVIIMLPDHVSMIMLSATVPNTMEVANWIGRTKRKKVHVVSTLKRPVPLEHYILAKGKMFKLMDAKGTFMLDNLKEAVKDDKLEAKKEKLAASKNSGARGRGGASRGRGGGRGGSKRGGGDKYGGKSYTQKSGGPNRSRGGRPPGPAGREDSSFWKNVVDFLESKNVLPCVVFTFGKFKCEACGYGLTSTDLTSKGEKAEIESFVNSSVRRLSPADRRIPQILRIKELLKRGIGVHHAGLLPIIKEVVEMLFGKSLIKVLFATETFAMGVNMPTRTVIFNGIRKNDGKGFRELLPGEYTQMSGRAGRRGLDDVGIVFLSVGDGENIPSEHILKTMLKGRSTRLSSQFRLTYNMILNLLRVEDLKVEDMIKRSFSEYDSQKDTSELEKLLVKGRKKLSEMPPLSCAICSKDVNEFYTFSKQLADLSHDLNHEIANKAPDKLQTGRVLVARSRSFGVATGVILYDGQTVVSNPVGGTKGPKLTMADLIAKKKAAEPNVKKSKQMKGLVRALLVQPSTMSSLQAGINAAADASADGEMVDERASVRVIDGYRCELVDLKAGDIVAICKETLKVEKAKLGQKEGVDEETLSAAVQQLLQIVQEAEAAWGPGGMPEQMKDKDLKINNIEFQEAYWQRNEIASQLGGFRCWQCPDFATHYRTVHRKHVLQRGIARIRHAMSDQSLYLMPEFQCRLTVLKVLKHIDEDETVLLKGRVACEVSSSESLIVTELMFQNVLSDLSAAECVSLLSCLIFQEKVKYEVKLTPTLERARKTLMDITLGIAQLQVDSGIKDIDPKEYLKEMVHDGMMEASYEWARGVPFIDICKLTDVFEGSIVRCISRLDELCRMVKNGARIAGSLGDAQLFSKMEEASALIKRDIVFAASLYVT